MQAQGMWAGAEAVPCCPSKLPPPLLMHSTAQQPVRPVLWHSLLLLPPSPRCLQNAKNCLREGALAKFLDLVVW